MKTKTIYLMGGLGNTLFQLNYFYNLRAHGVSVKVDCTLLRGGFFTKKVLHWSDHQTLDVLKDLQLLDDVDVRFNSYKNIFLGALAKFIGRDLFSARYCGLVAPEISDLTANHLFGYFHQNNPINQTFVEKIRSRIKYTLDSSEFSNVSEALQTIGHIYVVHVRGGDYTHDPSFIIPNEYYRKALSGQRKCYIVTNDKDFSKNIFENIEIEYEFLKTKSSFEDFIVLALSLNKILANSTFSWWAAESGNSKGDVVQGEPFFSHIKEWNPDSKISRRLIVN